MLALSYDEAFERHVLGMFQQQDKQREVGAEEAAFDSARIDPTVLRKGHKPRRHADDLICQAIERTKQELIGRLILPRDPCSDARDHEHRDNAGGLRSNLLEIRGMIVDALRAETGTNIQTARADINTLGRMSSKIAHRT